MFVWGELKRRVPNSVRFCIGDIPIYIFKRPARDACLCMGELLAPPAPPAPAAPPAPPAPPAPHFVFLITL